MGRAVRFWTRALAFAILRASRLGERVARSLAYATFTPAEVDSLGVAEWEAFGERGMLADDQLLPWESELFAFT